ncbi:MAG: glycosyltransferase [Candidatus Omnitrophica bacterium]|nr:glycosyltransferase [Candidatus Omnitrophota bacterium]
MFRDVSVIIPTCGRIEPLRNCLRSLLAQDYPKHNLEIIVIDDRAAGATAQLVQEFQREHPRLKYFSQQRRGPAAARNRGISAAAGEIIAFVDDDCTADASWVRLMAEQHQNKPDCAAVGGETKVNSNSITALVGQFLANCSIELSRNGHKDIIFFPTCNVSFKKHVLNKNAFREDFRFPGGEDLEFFWRLYKQGYTFSRCRDSCVIHHRSGSLRSFLSQAYIYGRGNFLVQHLHRDHPLLKELKTRGGPFFVATLLNIIKIPRFSLCLGRKLLGEYNSANIYQQMRVYLFFALHKAIYIAGNIAEYISIKRKKTNKSPALPQQLILDITHACNLSCRICDIWQSARHEPDIALDTVKKTLSAAKRLGIREVALSGGEPLLREDILGIFQHAQNIGMKDLGILTNGVLVGPKLEVIRPYLLDNTISLVFSFDSLKPEVHNYNRRSDTCWQAAVAGLEQLAHLKTRNPQVNFNMITIVLDANLEELLDIALVAKKLGVNSIQFQPLLANNLDMAERKHCSGWITKSRLPVLDTALARLMEFKDNNPAFIKNSKTNLALIKRYYRNALGAADVRCRSAAETVLVSNQGQCTTCFIAYGDVKAKALEEILQSPARQKAHRRATRCRRPCLLPCFCDDG